MPYFFFNVFHSVITRLIDRPHWEMLVPVQCQHCSDAVACEENKSSLSGLLGSAAWIM